MKVGKKRAWSKAASVALAATLGAFMCVPAVSGVTTGPAAGGTGVQQAWAATSGDITINDTDDTNATYIAYQIFTGDVTDGTDGKTITNLAWSNNTMKTAVVNAIKAQDTTYTSENAQDAADFISKNIASDTTGVASGSFADKLAKAIESVTGATTISLTNNTAATAQAGGYYLIKTASKSDNKTATSPIYVVVGGTAVTVTPKKSTPTVTKTVKVGDETASTATDVQKGDTLTFTLTGTLPSNYATYGTYQYEFDDTPSGMDIDTSSIKVTVDGTEIDSSKYSTTDSSKSSLKVSFSNLKTQVPAATANSKIVVTYTATINDSAVMGNAGDGNTNKATVKYSNDPHNEGTGTSEESKNKVFTYELDLTKVDLGTEETLSGAVFNIKKGDKWLASDGTLKDSAQDLTVGSDGKLTVKGIDQGTYTVTEKTAPTKEHDGTTDANYTVASEFSFVVSATITGTGESATISTLTNAITNGSSRTDVIAGTIDSTSEKGDNKLTAAADTSANASTGVVNITVGDSKQSGLPITGMSGISWTLIVGGAVLILTIGYAVHTSRKRREEQE